MDDDNSTTTTRLERMIESRKRRNNYTTARKFMKAIAADYSKLQTSFHYLCRKRSYSDVEAAEDFFTDTMMKCYDTIKRRGFTGKFYIAYFTKSLEQNLKNLQKKETKDGLDNNLTLADENFNGDVQYLINVTPTELVEEDDEEVDDRERELRYQQAVKMIRLDKARKQLPEKYQQILYLHYDHKLKYRDIVRVLGVPMTTVKMRLNTARTLIKQYLK